MTTIEGHEVTSFKVWNFLQDAKKARIRACPEEEATGTAMADRLGRKEHGPRT